MNIYEHTLGNYSDLDSSNATAEAGYAGIFDVQEAIQKKLTEEITENEPDMMTAIELFAKGIDLLNLMYSNEDANTHRAIIMQLLREVEDLDGSTDTFIEKMMTICEVNSDLQGVAGDAMYSEFLPGNEDSFKEKIACTYSNKVINTIFAALQNVNLQELMYKDLLKMTLDTTYDYYKSYFGL